MAPTCPTHARQPRFTSRTLTQRQHVLTNKVVLHHADYELQHIRFFVLNIASMTASPHGPSIHHRPATSFHILPIPLPIGVPENHQRTTRRGLSQSRTELAKRHDFLLAAGL